MSDRKQNRPDNGTESLNNGHSAHVSDRLSAIRARLDAATPGPDHSIPLRDRQHAMDALYAHAPADIAWLLDQITWMEHERERVIEWLSDRAGTAADADEALFLFGLTRGFTPDGHPWAGACTCGAKTFDDCVCNGGEV